MAVEFQNSNSSLSPFTPKALPRKPSEKRPPKDPKTMLMKKKDSSRPLETMKTTTVVLTTPESAMKSSSASSSLESDTKDSCYFPGCRKDANCNCEICIASINATLDLMSQSVQRSSFTKLSAAAPKPTPRSPTSFNQLSLSTPKSTADSKSFSMSPPLNSTARMNFHEKVKKKKRELGCGVMLMRLLLGLGVVLGLEFCVSWVVSGILQPKLSVTAVRSLGEKSWVLKDINERLDVLKNELQGLTLGQVTNCSSLASEWKIEQDGLLLNSRCVLYKSMSEEVSIWGWPLQTAGLLTAEFSSRSFTVLSGRVTEWANGEVSYTIRRGNSSWTQGKWSASAVQLDAKTWILEYKQSSPIENARLVSALLEFLKFRISREIGNLKQEFWLLFALSKHTDMHGGNLKIPT